MRGANEGLSKLGQNTKWKAGPRHGPRGHVVRCRQRTARVEGESDAGHGGFVRYP